MLQHTFCHLPGIGPASEQRLWRTGFATWQDLAACAKSNAHPARDRLADLNESIQRFGDGDLAYFSSRLPARERWRLFFEGRPSCAFLDIETTGLGVFADITTVAIFDGRKLQTFVAGQNLEEVPAALGQYGLLVTYNGAAFDLPVLERFFGIRLEQAHIDLRYILAALGLKGGLKGVERTLGMSRPGMEEIDGFFAVLLWREYRRTGDPAALETLLAYNAQDTLNLERLIVVAHNRRVAETPFGHLALQDPGAFPNPFTPDASVIQRLRGQSRPYFGSFFNGRVAQTAQPNHPTP